jgi:hypothetical protein
MFSSKSCVRRRIYAVPITPFWAHGFLHPAFALLTALVALPHGLF